MGWAEDDPEGGTGSLHITTTPALMVPSIALAIPMSTRGAGAADLRTSRKYCVVDEQHNKPDGLAGCNMPSLQTGRRWYRLLVAVPAVAVEVVFLGSSGLAGEKSSGRRSRRAGRVQRRGGDVGGGLAWSADPISHFLCLRKRSAIRVRACNERWQTVCETGDGEATCIIVHCRRACTMKRRLRARLATTPAGGPPLSASRC